MRINPVVMIVVAIAVPALTSQAVESLVEAERAFARTSAEQGTRAAFLAFLADNSTLFRPGPVDGHDWVEKTSQQGGRLTWEPAFADVAASGDFGYTSGPWQFEVKAPERGGERQAAGTSFGHFVSVWRRPAGGPWKVVIDLGISHPTPGPAVRDVTVPDRQAQPDLPRGLVEASRETLLKADVAFGAALAANSVAAYEAHLTPEARVYREGALPAVGITAARALLQARSARLTARPLFASAAPSGELGYTYGSLSGDADDPVAYYVRIWRRDGRAPWRLVLDIDTCKPRG